MDGVRMISDIINHILSMNGAQGHRSRKPSHAATVSEDSPIQQEIVSTSPLKDEADQIPVLQKSPL